MLIIALSEFDKLLQRVMRVKKKENSIEFSLN